MRPYVSLTVGLLLLVTTLVATSGCTQSQNDTSGDPSAGEPAAADPQETAVPKAIQDLKEKIQPPGIPAEKTAGEPDTAAGKEAVTKSGTAEPKGTPGKAVEEPAEVPPVDEKAILAEAGEFVKAFLDSLQKGDAAAAETMMFNRELFSAVVSSGFRDILEGHVLTANAELLEKLITSLKGKTLEHAWEPGDVVTTRPRNPFIKPSPTLNKAVLAVTAEGARLEIVMDQMVYLDGSWYIFRFSTP